jgi:hypothetical protein
MSELSCLEPFLVLSLGKPFVMPLLTGEVCVLQAPTLPSECPQKTLIHSIVWLACLAHLLSVKLLETEIFFFFFFFGKAGALPALRFVLNL